MQKFLNIQIGQIKAFRNAKLLKAIVCSCLETEVIRIEKRVCELALYLLPESPTPTFEIVAKFVNQAFCSFITMIKILSYDSDCITIIILDRGHKTTPSFTNSSYLISVNNFRVPLNEAKKHNHKIVFSEGYAEEEQKMSMNSFNFSFLVEKMQRIIEAA